MMRSVAVAALLLAVAVAAASDKKPFVDDVLNALDPSVDPCDNFYRYACGGWIEANPLPADKARMTRSFTKIADRNAELTREALEDPERSELGNNFYESCMDMDAIEAFGVKGVKKLFELSDAVKDNATFINAVGQLHALGVSSALFTSIVGLDWKQPDHYISMVYQGGLALPDRSYYLDSSEEMRSIREMYIAHMTSMFVLVGEDRRAAADLAADVLAVEKRLAAAGKPRDQLTDPFILYNKLNVDGLQELCPPFPWSEYYAAIGRPDVTEVNVATPDFFANIANFIAPRSVNELRAYLRWHILHRTVSLLPADFLEEDFSFFGRVLYGLEEMQPRWRDCVDHADEALGDLTGALYVEDAFGSLERVAAQGMVLSIEKSMNRDLLSLDWLRTPAETTLTGALDKMEKLTNLIGYPDDPDSYSDVPVAANTFFQNSLLAWKHNFQKEAARLETPKDPKLWLMRANEVNAYYAPDANQMVFPAGILQKPFFSLEYPWSMNFGAIGVVMGHENSHGFDNAGSTYDGDGVLRDWWEPEVRARFQEKVDCVIEQYSNYEVIPGVFINGNLTQGENIGDMGGVKLTHMSYQRLLSLDLFAGMKDPSDVPGLTNEQLLFVSFAQSWCTVASDDYLKVQVKTDPHSPSEYRVIGPLQNYAPFAEAFECPSGSYMNPTSRCEVW